MMKAIRVDWINYTIDEVNVFSKEPVDGLYYRTDHGFVPIAYLMNPDKKDAVVALLGKLKVMKLELARTEQRAINEMVSFRI